MALLNVDTHVGAFLIGRRHRKSAPRDQSDLEQSPKPMVQFREKFPSNYSLLLVGPPGVGKFDYMVELLGEFLHAGERVLFVCVDIQPAEVRQRASMRNINLAPYEGRSFFFVDSYTASISENPGGTPEKGTIPVSSFSNLEGIGLAITKGSKELKPPVKILFYTISTLFLHNPAQTLAKFLQIISARVKTELGLILYAAHEGVHDDRTMALLSSLVDGVLEMRYADAVRREIRIHHMRGVPVQPRWVPFEMEKGEINPVPELGA